MLLNVLFEEADDLQNYEVIDANRKGHKLYIHHEKAYVKDGQSETHIYLKCQHANNKSKSLMFLFFRSNCFEKRKSFSEKGQRHAQGKKDLWGGVL